MSILVVGSVALDTVKTPMGERKDVLGGSATYFSVSASLFNRVRMVAVVGRDFPERHIDFLKKKKVDIDGLEIKNGKTFRWKGEYGDDFGNARTISTHLNLFSDFDPKIPDGYKKSEHLFLANIDPELQKKVLTQVKRPRLVACDTMNFWIENKRKDLLGLLKDVDMLFVNESEAKELTQEALLAKAGKAILKMGPDRVIVKKGENGALLFSRGSIFSSSAYLLEEIRDPTGAGDTFAGGVMGYLSVCKRMTAENLKKAIVYGNIMATFTVEGFSLDRLGAVSKKDLLARYGEYKKIT